ncbi:MAG: hypothetical protein NVSMB57_04160 [Actinomycetota bacterium]
MQKTRLFASAALAVVVLSGIAAGAAPAPKVSRAVTCPSGYAPLGEERRATPHVNAQLAAALRDLPTGLCVRMRHPESMREFNAAHTQFGAHTAEEAALLDQALKQQAAMSRTRARSGVGGAAGTWAPYGGGPQRGDDKRFEISNEGITTMAGRIDSFAYDPKGKRLFATMGTGGVWMTRNLGRSWQSIGDTLPSQVNGAVTWSSSGGGTLVVVSGEPIMAYGAKVGIGAFRSTNLGRTWAKVKGIPDGALGFQAVTDPARPKVIYVATSKGLYRSTDAGISFRNVNLPTGDCAGKTDNQRCLLANMVTDVIVQSGDKFQHQGGTVLAVVGYRAGARPFPQHPDVMEAPKNGLYRSTSGAPNTFEALAAPGFTPQNRIGNTKLGFANGPAQNHNYVYAIVQDARIFTGDPPLIDVPGPVSSQVGGLPSESVLEGVYVSPDFGSTWTQMANHQQIADNPAAGSALTGVGQATLFAPGVQAWYNEWIHPDPTRQDANGVPTRLTFGLEEVWQNEVTSQPQNGKSSFKVIGKYFAGSTCMLLQTGVPVCPTGREHPVQGTTTHPDQHQGIYIPDGNDGVTLVVGNDGGAYSQHADRGTEFSQDSWGAGINGGFNTLLPYHARIAKDGVVWYGLQDNGSGKIENGTYTETYGGDGTFVAVDPDNSNYAWVATPSASMNVTIDGGVTWHSAAPPVNNPQFANPFVMDPKDSNHIVTAGTEIVETLLGPNTCTYVDAPKPVGGVANADCKWITVYNLGTKQHPGDSAAKSSGTDPSNSMSAIDVIGDSEYAGFCGPCDIMNSDVGFQNGLATNVGGSSPPQKGKSNGWHIAEARGLPNRTITGVAIDPKHPRTVYVTLGQYARGWRPPGSFGDSNRRLGKGNVFRSTDAGKTFVNVSKGLPNVPATAVVVRGSQIIVGTDIGVFMSSDARGSKWTALDKGLPHVPVSSLQLQPGTTSTLIASTYGRSIYAYHFPTAARRRAAIFAGAWPALKNPLAGVLLCALFALAYATKRRKNLVPSFA